MRASSEPICDWTCSRLVRIAVSVLSVRAATSPIELRMNSVCGDGFGGAIVAIDRSNKPVAGLTGSQHGSIEIDPHRVHQPELEFYS